MAIFVKVVEKGTFRKAAESLSLAPSRTSQAVSDLEEYLGVSLFNRSTRAIRLTNEGQQFYPHALDMLNSAEIGLNKLNDLSKKPSGTLKVTLPAFLEVSDISDAIAVFSTRHPEIDLTLAYTEKLVDMLKDGFDLRIRASANGFNDSAMMSRKLCETKRVLVASKTYTDTKKTPQHPSELMDWNWIHFPPRGKIIKFTSNENETVSIPEHSCLSVNSINALAQFASQHAGVTILPENIAEAGLKDGRLIHVLPKWQLSPLECYAIWPDKTVRENLTLLLVNHILDFLKNNASSI